MLMRGPDQPRAAEGPPSALAAPLLDALVGAAATAFATLVLWTLPAFLGLPETAANLGLLVLALATAYLAVGPHPLPVAARRVPLAVLGALVLVGVIAFGRAAASAGGPAADSTMGVLWAWLRGAVPELAGAPAALVAVAVGLGVGLPLFQAARARRPTLAIAMGFGVLTLQWEFVDNAATRMFWPLVASALCWLAASRGRAAAREPALEDAAPQAWLALGSALVAGLAATAVLLVMPRASGPANLGAVGRWIDGLPLVGTLERSTREGTLGYGTAPAPTGGGAGGTGGTGAPAPTHRNGFDLVKVGFGPDVGQLGGAATPNAGTALGLWIHRGSSPLPSVLYLRGAVFDTYDGRGWGRSNEGASPDPFWPDQSNGALAASFLGGLTLPQPFRQVNALVTLGDSTGSNLFTALTPLRLTAPGLSWDTQGEAWAATSAGLAPYQLTAAVLPSGVYRTLALASYRPLLGGTLLSPLGALSSQHTTWEVEQAGSVRDLGGPVLPSDREVPPELSLRVRQLAVRWTSGLGGDPLLEALAIQQQLQRFPYTLDASAPPPGQDFVDYFLFSARRGYCTYYSTAMAVMLRVVGIPTRWVEGFRVAVPPQGGAVTVPNNWAHAWVEAYIPPYGWLTFDPTPGAPPPAQGAPLPRVAPISRRPRTSVWWALPGLLALVLVGAGVLSGANLLAERRPVESAELGAAVLWRTCERVGARWGCRRPRASTPVEYARQLQARFPALGPHPVELARSFGRVQFGPPLSAPVAERELGAMRRAWSAMEGSWRRASPLTWPLRRWL